MKIFLKNTTIQIVRDDGEVIFINPDDAKLYNLRDNFWIDDGITPINKTAVVWQNLRTEYDESFITKEEALNYLTSIVNFNLGGRGVNGITYVNGNYTIDPLINTVIATYQTGVIEITLPEANTLPNDGKVREFIVFNLGASGEVYLKTSGSDVFQNGASVIAMKTKGNFIRGGIAYPTLGQGVVTLSTIENILQARYSTTWTASNFIIPTPVPFDTTDIETNEFALEHNNINISRMEIKTTGFVELAYSLGIWSTGGLTYNVTGYLRVNGTTIVPGSYLITGNFGGEDQTLGIPSISYILNAGDYVELVLENLNLTGYVDNVIITMKNKV